MYPGIMQYPAVYFREDCGGGRRAHFRGRDLNYKDGTDQRGSRFEVMGVFIIGAGQATPQVSRLPSGGVVLNQCLKHN